MSRLDRLASDARCPPSPRAVSCASSFTSFATTAKPLPASPARAASIVAFNASRFVCSAIEVITFTTSPISAEDSPSFATVAFVDSATPTACAATRAASFAFCAISRIDAPISSAPVATVCTLRDTCSAAADTTPACADASSADAAICADDRRQLLRRRRQRVRGRRHRAMSRAQAVLGPGSSAIAARRGRGPTAATAGRGAIASTEACNERTVLGKRRTTGRAIPAAARPSHGRCNKRLVKVMAALTADAATCCGRRRRRPGPRLRPSEPRRSCW